jgi:hypothetical protein
MTDEAMVPDPLGFIHWLREHCRGTLLRDLSEALAHQVGAAVDATDKAGTITLKITVKPVGGERSGQMFVADDLKVSAPKPSKPATLFFWHEDDQTLRRNDPRQLDLLAVKTDSIAVTR